MDYCGPAGIPHSVFVGWDADDQDKALAWLTDQQSRCPQCGSRPEEWLTADGEKEVHPPPYEVESFVCWGCRHTDEYRKHLDEEGVRAGHHIVLQRTDFSIYDPNTARFTDRMIPISDL